MWITSFYRGGNEDTETCDWPGTHREEGGTWASANSGPGSLPTYAGSTLSPSRWRGALSSGDDAQNSSSVWVELEPLGHKQHAGLLSMSFLVEGGEDTQGQGTRVPIPFWSPAQGWLVLPLPYPDGRFTAPAGHVQHPFPRL